MEITIDGKTRQLKFGIAMVSELDKMYVLKAQGGIEFAMGLNLVFQYLNQKNPTAIVNVIKANLPLLSKDKIMDFVEDYAAQEGTLDPLFDEILDTMGKHPVLSATLNNFKAKAAVTTDED